jgi:hypothetical protein
MWVTCEMSGETSASPPIDEPWPNGSAQAERALRRSADPAEFPNTLGASTGMLVDIGRKRLLPALGEAPAPRRAATAVPVGILLYLASVGIIATATIGVLFGIGFFLLTPPTKAMITNEATAEQGSAVERRRPEGTVKPSLPSGDVVSVPIQPEILRSAATAALPVAPLVPPASPPSPIGDATASPAQDQSTGGGSLLSSAFEPSPSAVAPAAPAVETLLGPPAAVPASAVAPSFSAGQITELLTRGDIFLHAGDVASARLFYERAADAGDRQAAMRMGATFDPAFLGRVGLHARGDQAKSLSWYRHALDLGAPKTDRQTQSPLTK